MTADSTRTERDPAAPGTVPRAETYRQLVERLRTTAGKSNRGAAGYTRWVNRRLGRWIAAAAYQRGFTPNGMTAASAVLTVSAIATIALVRPTWPVSIVITLLLVAGYAFDAADGQLARLRGGGSPAGEFLDHCVDAVKTSTVHLAVLICWYRFFDLSPATLLIPIGFAAVHPIFFFSLMLSDAMKARRAAAEAHLHTDTEPALPPSAEPAPVLQSLVVLPNDWGVMCLTFLLLPLHAAFLGVYAFLLAANTLFLLAGWVRWYRRL